MSGKRYVVLQPVWMQSSCNYDAEKSTRTLVVGSETTVGEIMAWANRPFSSLQRGDVVLTAEDADQPADRAGGEG